MKYRFFAFFATLVLSGCISTSQTVKSDYSGLSWSMNISDASGFDIMYTLGVCRVHTKDDNTIVRFEAQNPHWPEGILRYGTVIEKDSNGNFEASHNHSILFNLNRDKSYPEYPFLL